MTGRMGATDTIVAIATPPGRGGIGIIRVSGDLAAMLCQKITASPLPVPRKATYLAFHDAQGEFLDRGIVLYYPPPHSFTGEAVVEFQGHGSVVAMRLLLEHLTLLGARLANPGEFSQRAFLNGKMDLVQAEAIADLIESTTAQAARAAMRSLEGLFSQNLQALEASLKQLRVYVEATLDFPTDEIDLQERHGVIEQAEELLGKFQKIIANTQQGVRLREGLKCVIVGQPNVGKSSLFNAICRRDAAIITDLPGTTRDVLHETLEVQGLPVLLSDTAGLRIGEDVVEQEGIRRAWREVQSAELILLVCDDTQGIGVAEEDILQKLPASIPVVLVFNKIDQSGRLPSQQVFSTPKKIGTHRSIHGEIAVSARQLLGIELIDQYFYTFAGLNQQEESGVWLARSRHLMALKRAEAALQEGVASWQYDGYDELLAEGLRQSHQALGEIVGQTGSDELLGEIFSQFCIGK